MLVELDGELPLLRIMQYEFQLAGNGFHHVSQLVDEEVGHHLQDRLNIPLGVVIELQSRASRVMRRTQKLKVEE